MVKFSVDMQLFYNQNFTADSLQELTAGQSHHCVNVLRMGSGSTLWVSDGAGTLYECRIVEPSAKRLVVEVIATQKEYGKRPYTLDLAVAPTKNFDRMEWLVEKATEVGIDSFTPLLCEHSERKVVKDERLIRIVESAAAQSEKAYLPRVNSLTPFKKFIADHPKGLIAHCIDGAAQPKITLPAQTHYTILIGPEGDFSPAELDRAIEAGYQGLTLGSERLRTETAALYATIGAAFQNFSL
ncbi:MAG: RsmE family RNA methyltransferase [Mucinivorans sp.]